MFFEQYSHEPYIAVARFIRGWLPADSPRRAELPRLRERGHQALAVMEKHLAANAWFTGESYGIADIALFAYTDTAADGGFDLDAVSVDPRVAGEGTRDTGVRGDSAAFGRKPRRASRCRIEEHRGCSARLRRAGMQSVAGGSACLDAAIAATGRFRGRPQAGSYRTRALLHRIGTGAPGGYHGRAYGVRPKWRAARGGRGLR